MWSFCDEPPPPWSVSQCVLSLAGVASSSARSHGDGPICFDFTLMMAFGRKKRIEDEKRNKKKKIQPEETRHLSACMFLLQRTPTKKTRPFFCCVFFLLGSETWPPAHESPTHGSVGFSRRTDTNPSASATPHSHTRDICRPGYCRNDGSRPLSPSSAPPSCFDICFSRLPSSGGAMSLCCCQQRLSVSHDEAVRTGFSPGNCFFLFYFLSSLSVPTASLQRADDCCCIQYRVQTPLAAEKCCWERVKSRTFGYLESFWVNRFEPRLVKSNPHR